MPSIYATILQGVNNLKDDILQLNGRVALVTGGASGIGKATARKLVNQGAKVVIADINSDMAKALAEELGPNALSVKLDVSQEANWKSALDTIVKQFGAVDVLVNCAGVGTSGNFEELTLEDWNWMLSVNLTGVFLGCKHTIAAMRETGGGGSIINISSIGGLVGGEDIAGYCASKGGVTMLTKSVALHCAKHAPGVRCNSVHPTYVDSEMLDPIAEMFPDRATMLAGMAQEVPIGRVATPDDIANVIMFLASNSSGMMTGSQVLVDGGQLAGMPSRHSG